MHANIQHNKIESKEMVYCVKLISQQSFFHNNVPSDNLSSYNRAHLLNTCSETNPRTPNTHNHQQANTGSGRPIIASPLISRTSAKLSSRRQALRKLRFPSNTSRFRVLPTQSSAFLVFPNPARQ